METVMKNGIKIIAIYPEATPQVDKIVYESFRNFIKASMSDDTGLERKSTRLYDQVDEWTPICVGGN